MHYNRWNKTGSLEITKVTRETCTVEGCTKRHDARGYCDMHGKRWRKRGDVEFTLTGPNHPHWAENPTYGGAHLRVRRLKGRASLHACVDCGNQAADWSYIGGAPDECVDNGLAYSGDPAYYIARCRLCHSRYDNGGRVKSPSL
jgi:hypothetical protein